MKTKKLFLFSILYISLSCQANTNNNLNQTDKDSNIISKGTCTSLKSILSCAQKKYFDAGNNDIAKKVERAKQSLDLISPALKNADELCQIGFNGFVESLTATNSNLEAINSCK